MQETSEDSYFSWWSHFGVYIYEKETEAEENNKSA